jgi:membrane protein implicated in regulation of membrane protease activity
VRPAFLFHAAVLAGLLVLVRVMIAGVEMPGSPPLTAGQKLRVRLGPALIGVFLLVTGLVGAAALPLGLPLKAAVATSLLSGLLLAALAKNLVVTAASLPVTDHEFDPRYALQGVPGVVVEPIPPTGQGAVELRGDRGVTVARYAAASVDGVALPAGVEVAVERVEGEVAYVEAWSAVERRL